MKISQNNFEKLPDLSAFGSEMMVPFTARRLRNPTITWLNQRWFLENGFNVFDETVLREIEAWLLDEFAFAIPQASDTADAFMLEEKVFHADRYGGEGLVFNGGSGRVGVSGLFQVKGIGRTPLASHDTDFFHSHGGASLEEAIREAIYSEVVCAEFPFGGVPIIAVIETGTFTHWASEKGIDGVIKERRALLVRPSFIRPAHFERAVFFRGAEPAHVKDAGRVKVAIHHLLGEANCESNPTPSGQQVLLDFAKRIVAQMAFGCAHRLCHGAYATSNMTWDGELADYGSTAAVPAWERLLTVKGHPAFGLELNTIKTGISSLAFYFKKYGGTVAEDIDEIALIQAALAEFERVVMTEMLGLFGIGSQFFGHPLVKRLAEDLARYFQYQQCFGGDIFIATPQPQSAWLYDSLPKSETPPSEETKGKIPAADVIETVKRTLEALSNTQPNMVDIGWSIARRLLKPRDQLYRIELKNWIDAALVNGTFIQDKAAARRVIAEAIRRRVSVSRRVWRNLPEGLMVLGQVVGAYSVALFCKNGSGEKYLLMNGSRANGIIYCFNAKVPIASVHGEASTWIAVPMEQSYCGETIQIAIGRHLVNVPAMEEFYPEENQLLTLETEDAALC